jgi:hypothetical protein
MGAIFRPWLAAVHKRLGQWGTRSASVRFPTPAAVGRAILPAVSEEIGYGRLLADRRVSEAQEALANHFRRRIAPRFFLTAAELTTASSNVHGIWREQTIAEAERWRRRVATAAQWGDLAGPSIDATLQDQQHWLQMAIPLARAALYGQDTGASLRRLLSLWMQENETNPAEAGYSHPLLAVYRSVSLSWALAYLQAAAKDTHALECDLIRILLVDADFIHGRLGTSFPNNHLLADGFGLWYLGTLLPEFASAGEWRRKGEALWLQELARQIHEDGSSFEHSVHYQEFACEMGTLYWLLSGRNGSSAPSWAGSRVRSMLHFLVALGGQTCRPPQFGDCVEGVLIGLDSAPRTDTAAYAELEPALFGFHDGLPVPVEPSERAFWLMGRTTVGLRAAASPGLESFLQGGVHIFNEANAMSRLVFRTGPLEGRAVNPGHMHADLLSICLDVAGESLAVDAGTYTYRSGLRHDGVDWRGYFLGPACHNGLLIEGSDPLARGAGDFPPGPPQSMVEQCGSYQDDRIAWVERKNVGTTSYAGHRRGVIHVRGRFWVVYDVLPAGLPLATVSMGLQLAPGVEVELVRNGVRIAGEHANCWCVTDASLGLLSCRRGEKDPPAGWVSVRYGHMEPAPQLRFRPNQAAPLYAFLLQPILASSDEPPALSARRVPGGETVLEVSERGRSTTRVTVGSDAVSLSG